jgi:hypothetical protein
MRVRALLIAGLAALATAAPASADTWTVTNGSSDATTACNAAAHTCVSLRAAIAASEATKDIADTINVPAGTINLNNDLVVQSDITIAGTSARTNIIDGGSKYRGFRVSSSGSMKLSHFTIRNGAPGGDFPDGGGVLNDGLGSVLDNVRVTSSSGGGVVNLAGGTLGISHSLIDANTGGGIVNQGGPEVTPITFVAITDTTVFGNTGETGRPGGIVNLNRGLVSILRATVADNTAGARGPVGGLAMESAQSVQVAGSILARNKSAAGATVNCNGSVRPTDGGYNVEDNDTCGFNLTADPRLDTKLSNAGGEVDVLVLAAGSPAIDRLLVSDTNCTAGTRDQRGLYRPQGAQCDSGAYELDQAATMTITGGPSGTVPSGDVEFTFNASEPGVAPLCQLTGPGQPGGYVACYKVNAQPYSGLANGAYTFSVRDGAFPGSTPATRTFTVAGPDTTITGGPSGPTNDTTPQFTFTGANASSFQCRVDSATFATCTSPHTTAALAPGAHTFEVRALSATGLPDSSPASREFTVDTTAPDTNITGGPTGSVASTTAAFTFTATQSGSTFQCSLDGAAFGACPASYTGLAQGQHTFRVRAIDAAGNVDGSPAERIWTVDTLAPAVPVIAQPAAGALLATPSFALSGTGEAGATIVVREGATIRGTATATGGNWTVALSNVDDGSHTYEVRATDAAGNTSPAASRSVTIDAAGPNTTISSGPPGLTNVATPAFTFGADEAGARFECRVDASPPAACTSPFTAPALADGEHTFSVLAIDAAGNRDPTPATQTFVVDLTPPAEPTVVSGPDGPTTDPAPAFAFAATETVTCRLDGPSGPGTFAACVSPTSFGNLAPGDYVFVVRSVDAAGNSTETRRAFAVTVPQQATPTPEPTVGPAQTPTPTPEPGKSVVVTPAEGTILVRRPGTTTFEPLGVSTTIPFGSEVDARNGKVRLTSLPTAGAPPETADFYDGLFTIHRVGGFVELRLSEKLTDCKPAKKTRASASQKKPKSRKLWGDGKGKFRTKGQYSSATIGGTKWLVQDTCTTTLTRVAQGVVAVKDFAKRKTVLVKAPKRYTARPKKR